MPHTKDSPGTGNIFFRSGRELTLRFVTLVCLIPVPLTVWLLTLPPSAEWADTPVGPTLWWLVPALLLALALALPLSLGLVHDRYVLELAHDAPGRWRITTFLLWGRRTREFSSPELAGAQVRQDEGVTDSTFTVSVAAPYMQVTLVGGKRLILDCQCEAPHGWEAIEALFKRK